MLSVRISRECGRSVDWLLTVENPAPPEYPNTSLSGRKGHFRKVMGMVGWPSKTRATPDEDLALARKRKKELEEQ